MKRSIGPILLLILPFVLPDAVCAVPAGTIEFPGGGAGQVVFDATAHVKRGARCSDCHPLFKMKRGATVITMADINAGRYCGACHDGTKAFKAGDASNCARCHDAGGSGQAQFAVITGPAATRRNDAGAAPATQVIAQPQKEQPDPHVALDLALGWFKPNSGSPGLANGSGGLVIGLGVGVRPRALVSFRVEYVGFDREYDSTVPAPPAFFVHTDNRMDLFTSALLLGLRFSVPEQRWYRFYADGGIGRFKNTMSLEGMYIFTLQTVTFLEEEDSSIGYYAGVGVEADISSNALIGLEYRRYFDHATFPAFGLYNVDIGGTALVLKFGWTY